MKRAIEKCILALLALVWALTAAAAGGYPDRPIRLIVGFPPGGVVDLTARLVGQKLGGLLGQQIVIENRGGASGMIGAQAAAQAPADGYTLFLNPGDFITLRLLMPHSSFDPMKELLPIAIVSENPMAVVAGSKAPFNTVPQMIADAKANPHGLTYATPGISTSNNIVGLSLAQAAHIKLVHVPYRGGADAAVAVAAGDVAVGVFSPTAVYPGLVNAGKIKIIALSGDRPAFLPSTWPTLAQYGLPINVTLWNGIFAPIGTPQPIVDRLEQAIAKAVADDTVQKRMNQAGTEAKYLNQAAFIARIHSDISRFDRVIRASGVRVAQ
jgi:tripartite-type tricarboxylate transporter receptor subunit TctC